MAELDIRDFDVLTFDCYGTLIDWERGLLSALREWASGTGVAVTDRRLLEVFAAVEPVVEHDNPAMPYRDLLRRVHARLADQLELPSSQSDQARFAASVGTWPPFPDTVAALEVLARRYRLVILSNVDGVSFAGSRAQLGVDFAAVVTAEDVGAYKPDHRMFERMFDVVRELGFSRDRILHVAQSLYHDHVPARELGLRSVWVNRRGTDPEGWGATPPPSVDVTPDLEVPDLASLAALLER